MPRMLWKDGIASLKNIHAYCRVGIMFTIVIISLQDDGIEYFENVLGHLRKVNDMRECFQMILCYWMWLKKISFGDQMTIRNITSSLINQENVISN